ncbi:MAG: DNA polymerase III subunit delta' [Clostridioides sp.]|jgi:DNA polymerase-3 subunit delta'|nr:DNA polymerase III subunit delta' [Clostridioides sp.]
MYFDGIIGQDFAKKYLINSIKTQKLNSSYLFEGIDGIGKKKTALEFSKILLEVENPQNSSDFNDIFPEGQSVKIEQIRKLESDIVLKPRGNYKIYIINDAQKMTHQAQNALLKTLEEPPSYAVIILISNNKNALLETIVSRCDSIKFSPISKNDTIEFLKSKFIDENKSKVLASFASGSLQRALDLAENEEFSEMRRILDENLKIIFNKDVVSIMELANNLTKYKNKIYDFLDIMLNYFRDVAFLKEGMEESMIINVDKIFEIKKYMSLLSYSQISKIIVIIEDTKKNFDSNCNFNLNLQVMFLNIYEVIK